MRHLPLILALGLPAMSYAETYLTENFANYIPSAFTVVNADGGSMRQHIYSRMGNDPAAPWVAGQLANGYGRAALCPTRLDGTDAPTDRRMILPSLTVGSADAVVQWEARSMHAHCAESYRLAIRQSGATEWTDLYVCDSESGYWAMHTVSLADYVGMDVEIAFIATTAEGFILAVDNIFVGVPEGDKFRFESRTPHYVGDDGAVTVSGTLTYYGQSSPWTSVQLAVGDDVQTAELPALGCGESAEVEFTVYPAVGQRLDYKLTALADGVKTDLYSDFISCSYYPRTHIIDRGSGTWCSQCPPMQLTTDRLSRLYGDEAIIIEAHINDALTDTDYWSRYFEGNVYSIPCLIPNHDLRRNVSSLKSSDDFSSKLHTETVAKTEAKAVYMDNGDVRVSTKTTFAVDADNDDDRYRVGYMMVGDMHDTTNPQYMQSLSVSNFNGDQYFYMPETVMPEMMYYDAVPLSAESAYTGVPASLPQTIRGGQQMAHEFTLAAPNAIGASDKRIVVMVIDTADGTILNAAICAIAEPTGITAISADADPSEPVYYDVSGRRVLPDTPGILIRQGLNTIKIVNHN